MSFSTYQILFTTKMGNVCSSNAKSRAPAAVHLEEKRKRLSVGSSNWAPDAEGLKLKGGKKSAKEEDRALLLKLNAKNVVDVAEEHGWGGDLWTVRSMTDRYRRTSFQNKTVTELGRKEPTEWSPFCTPSLASSRNDDDLRDQIGDHDRETNQTEDENVCGWQALDFSEPIFHRKLVAHACKKGLKPEAPNQDSFFIIKVGVSLRLYGVLDGHGPCGHDVSEFCKATIPKLLLMDTEVEKDPPAALKRAFVKTEQLLREATLQDVLDARNSGTTATVVLHNKCSNEMWIAWTGDSRAVIGRWKCESSDGLRSTGSISSESCQIPTCQLKALDISYDHVPQLSEEKARIEKAGGRVIFDGHHCHRVYTSKLTDGGGLNMSRALGDLLLKPSGVSCIPTVRHHRLVLPENKMSNVIKPSEVTNWQHLSVPKAGIGEELYGEDEFLIMASDGVWEFIDSQEAVEFINNFIWDVTGAKWNDEENTGVLLAQQSAEGLAQESWNRWVKATGGNVVDDITCVIIVLNKDRWYKAYQARRNRSASSVAAIGGG